ncbi:lysophospholipid acyltransferase family protein [Geothrix edaphica]|uniref:Acyltransferase n=1 Tax=Geothrix edaphica TaxID=2927976 RepID=A0ABQ5Q0G3_9BACT|nr:lysophospholipid acyltransferase family protein [Geothrix edaphica]GLH68200.1 acyltransferase [Geothrix edaphica]
MQKPLEFPITPAVLHQPRGWVWRAIGRVYLRLAGWRIEGTFPAEPKFVTIVAPHTSNWDFALGVAVVFALELRVSWLGKHSLFQTPLRRFFFWLGGIPVDRRAAHGVVDACVKAFEGAPARLLALAPEGTRKGVSQWKSGFYRIAIAADVPIWPVGFDFRDHVVRLMPVFRPTGDLEADLPHIQALFNGVHGLRERAGRGTRA